MSKPRTPEDLLREMQGVKEDLFTLSMRHARLLEAAREIVAGPKVTAKPAEALKT
jgi:hypothetical protein